MSNYTKSTNFATKDNLTPGDPLKVVRGTEIDTEYNNIATAIATKTDNASAAITGGTITGITDLAVADGGTGASTAAGALNNLLPSQTSAANKYLQSDGTNASWDAVTLSTADITGTLPVANGGTGVTASTGTGSVVLSNSPTLVTPALGTPSALVGTNITGTASGLTAGNVTTNANLTGGVTSVGNAATVVTNANLTGAVTSVGNATSLGSFTSANLLAALTDETGTGSAVFATSPTLVTPALGTPSALVGTNITGTASGLTAGNVTTNANLTGAITSTGNATSLGSFSSANLLGALTDETGTGSAVFATSPTLVTPILGTPTSATLTNATGLPIATGVSGLGTGVATFLTTPSSANLAAALTDETGSGANVFATSPTLVTPILGTPTSATLTNATGLPISTGVSGLGTGIATALAVNVGSSGAPLVNGGVLGTPSSGTATNLTGLPLTTGVTGTLPTANGGTNLGGATPFTSGGVVYASSTSALATGSGLTFDGTTPTSSNAIGSPNFIFNSNANTPYIRFDQSSAAKLIIGASAIVAGGAGYDFYGAAGIGLTFHTNAARRLDITSTGEVGIGTTNPLTKLVVSNGGAEGLEVSPSGGIVNLTAYNRSGGAYAQLNLTGTGGIAMSLGPSYITTNTSMSISNVVAVGGATPSASGAGITFPATQSASSDANTLDDYEEGTWTPTITFGAGSTGITYSLNSGFYTKIGSQVFLTGVIELSSKGSATGYADIRGLPFTVQNASGAVSAASMRFVNISFSGAFEGFAATNSTLVSLSQITLLGAVSDLTDVNFSNNSSITISVNYRV